MVADISVVYCDCVQVITGWSYPKVEAWVYSHSKEYVENFIKENW